MRCGVLTKKLGMTQIFTEEGQHVPVSVLALEGARILDVRDSPDEDDQVFVRVSAGTQKASRLSKPLRGVFEKAGSPPMKKTVCFVVSQDCRPEGNVALSVGHFVQGQFVDARATSIGKGFAGVMKRHGFKGLRASHGVSVAHRTMGSTGNREYPGKVFKGKKMPGHMGNKRTTVQNLKVVALDEDNDIIFVKGAVPGARNSWVVLSDAVKKPLPKEAPRPAGVKSEGEKTEDSS